MTLETYFKADSAQQTLPDQSRKRLLFVPSTSTDFPPSYLVSVAYDGSLKKCFLRLYDPSSHKIHFWYDDTGHKPYCFSKQSVAELEKNVNITRNPGFDHFEQDSKFEALRGQSVNVTKIVAKDPLTIGGKTTGSIRDELTAWEADIKYVENYVYDRGLEPGMMYQCRGKQLSQVDYKLADTTSKEIDQVLRGESLEYKSLANEWMRLLECPVPQYRRVALDIEVANRVENRIPDPEMAEDPVICVSLVGSNGTSRVLLLERKGTEEGEAILP